ncbi:sulfotransferase [uncultured Cocleimonas sp.]|uniref:sulfotransferase family protein n=1 Tax=uncultured Cocleimonas sp. TaxID=1051587 RepID=UPI00260219D8|nr:sulfotransferase [uncultured Cocleimonas sp.]
MTLPNFLIIGAGRAGTTSMYNYLNQHPQIFMSPVKEPRFFAYVNNKPEYKGPPLGINNLERYSTDLSSYKKLFSQVSNETAIGEASVDYLYLHSSAERMKVYIPDVKIIIILRQPVDRAYSQFWARVSSGMEPLTDFFQAMEAEDERMRNNWPPQFHYKQKSFYASSLKHYFQLFDKSQIKIILYDDYSKDPKQTLNEITNFLGVNNVFEFDLNRRYNSPRGLAKFQFINKIRSSRSWVKTTLKDLIPSSFLTYLRNAYNSLQFSRRPSLDKKLRKELTSIYIEDILEVEKLIKRDLSEWMK